MADLEKGLHRKWLISFGGLLKEIYAELHPDDAEDGDYLIYTDDDAEKVEEKAFSIIAFWNWERRN